MQQNILLTMEVIQGTIYKTFLSVEIKIAPRTRIDAVSNVQVVNV